MAEEITPDGVLSLDFGGLPILWQRNSLEPAPRRQLNSPHPIGVLVEFAVPVVVERIVPLWSV